MGEDDKRARSYPVGASRLDALRALRMRPIHPSWLGVDGVMPTGAFADRRTAAAKAREAGVAWKPTGR